MSYQVLVVEDHLDQLEMFSEILRDAGFAVRAASTGDEAVRLLFEGKVDLLIADIRLSADMDGFELASVARLMYPKLQVLFVTGFSGDMAVPQRSSLAGARILLKPFSLTDFVQSAKTLLSAPAGNCMAHLPAVFGTQTSIAVELATVTY